VSVSGVIIDGGEIIRKDEPGRTKQMLLRGIIIVIFVAFAVMLSALQSSFWSPWIFVQLPILLALAAAMAWGDYWLDAAWSGGPMVRKLSVGHSKRERSLGG